MKKHSIENRMGLSMSNSEWESFVVSRSEFRKAAEVIVDVIHERYWCHEPSGFESFIKIMKSMLKIKIGEKIIKDKKKD